MNPTFIDIKDFDYPLSEDKIAKYPLAERSQSKLLYYNKGTIEHRLFAELADLLPMNSMLIFNNTKVIEARLKFKKETGSEIEVFLLNPQKNKNASTILKSLNECMWHCMIGNKKRWNENDVLTINRNDITLTAKWENRENNIVQFAYPSNFTFEQVIQQLGNIPIPPYLNRPTELIDLTRYQTSFAQEKGSVAAPTAALHFDDIILEKIKQKNIQSKYLTLHVGAGTFKPVSVENALDHEMHREYIVFTEELIKDLLHHQGPIIPVGTTSFRSLESLYWFGVGLITGELVEFHIPQYFPYQCKSKNISVQTALSQVQDWMYSQSIGTLEGTSSIYIVPGYIPKMVKGIVTNFHQPQSTLLLLIAAMVGNDWKTIYQEALENGYRFLSYGDSSLLLF